MSGKHICCRYISVWSPVRVITSIMSYSQGCVLNLLNNLLQWLECQKVLNAQVPNTLSFWVPRWPKCLSAPVPKYRSVLRFWVLECRLSGLQMSKCSGALQILWMFKCPLMFLDALCVPDYLIKVDWNKILSIKWCTMYIRRFLET